MEKLDSLAVKGFKSIQNEEIEFKNLNVVIGANGAGKSNLVDIFKFFNEALKGYDIQNIIGKRGRINNLLFRGPKITQKIDFELRFNERGYKLTIELGAEGFNVQDARYYEHGQPGWWSLPSVYNRLGILVDSQGKDKFAEFSKGIINTIQSWRVYQFHDSSYTAGMRREEIIQDNAYLRSDASNIAPYLLYLKKNNPDSYKKIVSNIRLVLPFFNDFKLTVVQEGESQKTQLDWIRKNSDYPMQPYHLSDGSIRFICLVTALLQPNPPSTLIIDEPELGLHPHAIAILAELINVTPEKTQIILATQSPTLVKYFEVEDIIVAKLKNGASQFNRLKKEDLKHWLEDYNLGELWEKNVIQGDSTYE